MTWLTSSSFAALLGLDDDGDGAVAFRAYARHPQSHSNRSNEDDVEGMRESETAAAASASLQIAGLRRIDRFIGAESLDRALRAGRWGLLPLRWLPHKHVGILLGSQKYVAGEQNILRAYAILHLHAILIGPSQRNTPLAVP